MKTFAGRRLLDVDVPVADAVQAMRHCAGVVERAREVQRGVEVGAGARVIPASPQEPEIEQALPLSGAIAYGSSARQRGLVVRPGGLEVAEPLVSHAPCVIQARRHRNRLATRSLDGAGILLDRAGWGAQGVSSPTSAFAIGESP